MSYSNPLPTQPVRGYRWSVPLLGALGMLLILAACGGDEENDAVASPDPSADEEGSEELPPEVIGAAAAAEERGLKFVTTREELEARAEEEGSLTAYWSMGELYEQLESFTDQYPFLDGNITLLDLSGVEARERFLLEAAGGALRDIDVNQPAIEVYADMAEYCDYDIYGMVEAGILDIPLEMIDPDRRTVVAAESNFGIFAYSKEGFADRELPSDWDDLLDPEQYGPDSGLNMLADVRAAAFAAMVPEWGLDRAVEWKAQYAEVTDPIWIQRAAPFLVQVAHGEYDAYPFVNLHVTSWYLDDEPNLGYEIIEPVPVRIMGTHCVFNEEISNNPHAALLFLEWTASEAGQRAIIEADLGPQNHYASGLDMEGAVGPLLEGLELSILDWDHFPLAAEYIEATIGAVGFPEPVSPD